MSSTKRSAVDDLSKEEKFICLEKEKENVNIEKLKSGEFKVVHGSMEMESSFTTWFRLDAIPQNWKEALVEKESKKEYWKKLMRRLMAEDLNKSLVIYPNPQDRFSFMTLPLQNIKIVILGQDPYHGPNQAHGLSFSVQKGIKIPPSLVNIYKELQNDLGVETFGKDLPNHGYLKEWHDQGVLMLNATLTVQKTRPNSHAKYGWQNFTDEIIKYLGSKHSNIVFCLWGKFAQGKDKFIPAKKHLILKAAHPSPLGANKGGWWGCKHFSKANQYLEKHGKASIEWRIT